MKLIPGHIYKYQSNGVYYFFKAEMIWMDFFYVLFYNKSRKIFETPCNLLRVSSKEDKYYTTVCDRPVEIMPITEEDKLYLL